MSWVAVAIGGAAVIGAGASLAGSSAQAGAASNAAQLSQKQYEQNRADMSPWRITGQNALAQYAGELGIPGYNYGGGGGMQPQVYGTPQPYTSGGAWDPVAAARGATPDFWNAENLSPEGLAAARGGRSQASGLGGLHNMLTPGGNQIGDWGHLIGMPLAPLGIGRKNNTPIQDIKQGLKLGNPISDKSWAMAGFGPGGEGFWNTEHPGQPTQGGAGDSTFHSGFRETPGYQFAYDEGMRGVNNAFAARGLLSSGARAKGIEKYGQGIADQEYNNYLNRLAAVSGVGQTTAMQGAQLGAQFAQNQGNLYQDRAAATASGYAGVGNALNSGIQNYLTYKNYGGGGNGFASYANGNWTPGPQGFPG